MQRLMGKGYGFAAEGDWKTAAMLRIVKLMTAGVKDAKELLSWRITPIILFQEKKGSRDTYVRNLSFNCRRRY